MTVSMPVKVRVIVLCGLLAGMGCRSVDAAALEVPAAVTTRHAGSRMLQSGALSVEVMEPGHPQRYNRGVRFTPMAAVLGVRLDGNEFLFNPVKHDPIGDHAGLAAEFDLVTPDDPDAWMPPGYAEAKVGEGFLKVGVGVLRKQRDRYSLFQQPALLEPAVTTVTWTPASAAFRQTCSGVNGYAYELQADLTVAQPRVAVTWTLVNTGRKPITTRQYTHNFFRLGDRDVGPDYVLSFPYDFKAAGLAAQQKQAGRDIRFEERIPQWVNMVVPYPPEYAGPNRCVLRQDAVGQSVTCETSMPGLRTAIHARPGYVSPEQFILLQVAPGQSVTWTRSYEFATGKINK